MSLLENRIPPPLVATLVAGLMWGVAQVSYVWSCSQLLRLTLVGAGGGGRAVFLCCRCYILSQG